MKSTRQPWGAGVALAVLAITILPLAAAGPRVRPTAATARARTVRAQSQPVSRADLAACYLRADRLYAQYPPAERNVAEVNRAFDRATLSFFGGNFADTLRKIDELALSLRGGQPTLAERLGMSLTIECQPAVLVLATAQAPPRARLRSLYALEVDEAYQLDAQLEVRDGAQNVLLALPVTLTGGPGELLDVRVPIVSGDLGTDRAAAAGTSPQTGQFALVLIDEAGQTLATGRLVVVEESLDAMRQANAARLDALGDLAPGLEQAVAACRARNGLLHDEPSEQQSAQFLVDPQQMAAEVAAEIESLAAGRNPYAGRSGDYWRALKTRRREIPLRLYVPDRIDDDEPLPLVIALHGAGGDENMFLEAYGAGAIKQLADQHRFIVASPLTYTFGGLREHFDLLVETLAAEHPIDRQRIYVVGHSMGGAAASLLARNCADQLAAACCLAGATGLSSTGELAPTLIVAARLDAIVPPERLVRDAEAAQQAGLPVELRVLEQYGHTLMVGKILPEVIDWLLAHRLDDRAEPPAASRGTSE